MAHRYYWLKLSSDFFYGEESKPYINRLRTECQSLGDTYIVIFIKLMLLSLNTEGILEYKGIFPSFEEELADALNEDSHNVKNTLAFFIKTPFLEEIISEDNRHSLFIPYVVKNTGSKTDSALRMEKAREKAKIKAEKSKLLETSQCAHNVTPRFKEDKSLKDLNLKETSQSDASRKGYGYHRNVYLSEKEYAYICNTYVSPNKILDDVSYWIKKNNAAPASYFETVKKFIQNGNYTRLDNPERLAAIENLKRVEAAYLAKEDEKTDISVANNTNHFTQVTQETTTEINDILNKCLSMLGNER